MITAILTIAMIISLIMLYKNLPNRKIFYYFCFSLMIVFAIAGIIARTQPTKETIDEKQRNAIQQQQKEFNGWYINYQKEIDQLDRNWKLYFTIIDNFKSENIDVETLQERLTKLETEMKIEQVNIHTLKSPDMSEECNLMIEEMIKKTQRYCDLQMQTVSRTRSAIELELFLTADHKEQIQMLENIIIRESPAGLFTSTELTAILNYFERVE